MIELRTLVNPSRILRFSLALGLLGLLLPARSARADQMTIANPGITINVTMGSSTENVLAGNVAGSLNGAAVPWMFCVDFSRTINVPGAYTTDVTSDGSIHGSAVSNAGEVAWLVQQFGASIVGNANAGAALQAAIWKTIYGSQFTLNTGGTILTSYNTYIGALNTAKAHGGGTASVAGFSWLSPSSNGSAVQGQITVAAAPEPSTLAIAALGGIAMVTYGMRRKTRRDASVTTAE